MGAGGSIAQSTEDERLTRAQQLYRMLDKEDKGEVNVTELRESFAKMRGGADDDGLASALFDQLDNDHNGTVSLEEFEAARVAELTQFTSKGLNEIEPVGKIVFEGAQGARHHMPDFEATTSRFE